MEWKHCAGITALCQTLEISENEYRLARAQISHVYVERSIYDTKRGKVRELCYPSQSSILYKVQRLLKDRVLDKLELLPEIRGYRSKSHNINTSADICGQNFVGKIDISKFHPSITCRHIATALSEHGLSPSWSQEIARMVTYKDILPQGAPTSNHIANIVMDSLLRRFVKPFASRLGIEFRNYGDDTAFYGTSHVSVDACVRHAIKNFALLGFMPSNKCQQSQHRGGKREFIGCATGRQNPDYPRKKYRAFKKELRALLQAERLRSSLKPLSTKPQLNSLKHRIAYVKRLNSVKARNLLDLFYRLCHARRGGPQMGFSCSTPPAPYTPTPPPEMAVPLPCP